MMNKKGQVTIFVIVGIILVVTIGIVFLVNRNEIVSRGQDFDNPESYIDNCIREVSSKVISEMLSGAGFIESNDTILYNGNEITYLCKNLNNFEPCINQHPIYLGAVEKEFESEIKDDVEQCFASVEQEFVRKNYEFEFGPITIDSKLKPSIVEILVTSDLSINKGDFSKTFSRFETIVQSSLYDISLVVNEIVAQEAQWCYFSTDGFMTLYKDYDIRISLLDDTTKIYTVKDRRNQDKLTMAIRGCALPAGLF